MLFQQKTKTFSWYDSARTILTVEVENLWSWDDAYLLVDSVNEMVFSASQGIYTIYNMHQRSQPKSNRELVSRLSHMVAAEVPNEELTIIVGASPQFRACAEHAGEIYGVERLTRIHFVSTFRDALRLIQQHRAANLN